MPWRMVTRFYNDTVARVTYLTLKRRYETKEGSVSD
jgi:hypothetical protein